MNDYCQCGRFEMLTAGCYRATVFMRDGQAVCTTCGFTIGKQWEPKILESWQESRTTPSGDSMQEVIKSLADYQLSMAKSDMTVIAKQTYQGVGNRKTRRANFARTATRAQRKARGL